MHDAERVRVADRLAALEEQIDGLFERETSPRLEDAREVRTRQVLHHHVRRAVGEGPHVEHPGHVLVLHADPGACLARESPHDLLVLQQIWQQELQREELPQLQVPGGHDDAHTAHAEDALDAVLPRHDVPRLDGAAFDLL